MGQKPAMKETPCSFYHMKSQRELRTTKEVLRKHRPVRTLLLDFSAFRAKMCLFVY